MLNISFGCKHLDTINGTHSFLCASLLLVSSSSLLLDSVQTGLGLQTAAIIDTVAMDLILAANLANGHPSGLVKNHFKCLATGPQVAKQAFQSHLKRFIFRVPSS